MKNQGKTISIIVRTCNRPIFLSKCLKSILEQIRRPDEVVVVNDGGKSVNQIVAEFDALPIKLIDHKIKMGRAASGNLGVQNAVGEAVGFLDDDDLLLPDHIARLEQAMLQFDSRVVYSGCSVTRENVLGDESILKEEVAGEYNDPYDEKRLKYENYIPLISLLIDRTAWEEIGGFDTSFDLFEDWDMLIRLSSLTPFYHVNKITSVYRIWGEIQITQATSKTKWLNAYQRIIQKHMVSDATNTQLELLSEYWMVSQQRRAHNQDLNLNYHLIEGKNRELEGKNRELEGKNRELEGKNRELEGKNRELEGKNRELEGKNRELEGKNRELEGKNRELEGKNRELEGKNRELEDKYEDLKIDRDYQKKINEITAQTALGFETAILKTHFPVLIKRDELVTYDAMIRQLYGLEDPLKLKRQIQYILGEIEKCCKKRSGLWFTANKLNELLIESIGGWLLQLTVMNNDAFDQQVCSCSGSCDTVSPICNTELDDIPVRPVSNLLPTYACIAGSDHAATVMETDLVRGEIPYLLSSQNALVFDVTCCEDHFYRVDILFSLQRKVCADRIRMVIRSKMSGKPVRIACIAGVEVLNGYFTSFRFQPIADSKGRGYTIELDAPDSIRAIPAYVMTHPVDSLKSDNKRVDICSTESGMKRFPQWMMKFLVSDRKRFSQGKENIDHLFLVQGVTPDTPSEYIQFYLDRMMNTACTIDSEIHVWFSGDASGEVLQAFSNYPNVKFLNKSCAGLITDAMESSLFRYLWLTDLYAVIGENAIAACEDLYGRVTDAGMVVPMEIYADGTIAGAYGILVRYGLIETVWRGAPSSHPYHRYFRSISAAYSGLAILPRSAIEAIDLDILSSYDTAPYRITEMIWQLLAGKRKTYYDARVQYERIEPIIDPVPEMMEKDRKRFYERWKEALPLTLTHLSPMSEKLNPENKPTAIVIDATLPTFDEDSGSLRLYSLLEIWSKMGWQITFYSHNRDSNIKYRRALEKFGVEVLHGEYGLPDVASYRNFDIAWICRADIAHRYIPIVRILFPNAKILYDTVDIHYVRLERQAEIEQLDAIRQKAKETKRIELSNCLLADRVITVTVDDGEFLTKEIPGIHYRVIPNIHTNVSKNRAGFSDRDGLVFIGNYNHPPNEDAVNYFVNEVFPLIRSEVPDISFYVLGSNMKEKMKTLEVDGVKMVGWVEDVAEAFRFRRIFVSYLRYGAGMKGKIGQALALGLPVVTTSIGAEGMGLVDQETALIADDPQSFARAVCELYRNADLWCKLSAQGLKWITDRYGEESVRRSLQRILVELGYRNDAE